MGKLGGGGGSLERPIETPGYGHPYRAEIDLTATHQTECAKMRTQRQGRTQQRKITRSPLRKRSLILNRNFRMRGGRWEVTGAKGGGGGGGVQKGEGGGGGGGVWGDGGVGKTIP